jgi:hypothetical protein
VALMLQHRDGRKTLHPYAEYASAYRDTAIGQYLLITLESAQTWAAAREAAARMQERERRAEDLRKYEELLYAVAQKYPGETRHETALRYIKRAETSVEVTVGAIRAG